jgi:hypothetical protein
MKESKKDGEEALARVQRRSPRHSIKRKSYLQREREQRGGEGQRDGGRGERLEVGRRPQLQFARRPAEVAVILPPCTALHCMGSTRCGNALVKQLLEL